MKIETLGPDKYERLEPEETGTKNKFWLRHAGTGRRYLFKMGRNQIENWAEVVCYEIAKLLGIPCPEYKLAEWEGAHGVLSASFLDVSEKEDFIPGDYMLARMDPDYPRTTRKPVQYTISRTFALLKVASSTVAFPRPFGFHAGGNLKYVDELFVGYLMLDALVANQDRHHGNWGFVAGTKLKKIRMAPSFDHASSFSRDSDEEKTRRMQTRDRGYTLETYCERAKSPFYNAAGASRLTTYDAFQQAGQRLQGAANYWLARLEQADVGTVLRHLFTGNDSAIISPTSAEFALRMLHFNRARLLNHDCNPIQRA